MKDNRSFVLFRYWKLTLFAASIILAYFFFGVLGGEKLFAGLRSESALATALFAGVLYSFGFTSAFATGAFLSMKVSVTEALVLAAAGGLGSLFTDYTILKLVRLSFQEEFKNLRQTTAMRFAAKEFRKRIPAKVREYLLLLIAAFFIASPLPDEIGVSLIAGLTDLREKAFAVVSFLLNAAGILVILLL